MKKIAVLAIVLVFVLTSMLCSAAFADEQNCSITVKDNFKMISALRGGSTRLTLSEIFSDS